VDVVYPVRPGQRNEELRFSLRCLAANLPHDRVWLVGEKPSWVSGVEFIGGGNPHSNKTANYSYNVLLACRENDVPDEFLLFNDDFFVTAPMEEIPVYHRGALSTHLRVSRHRHDWWAKGLRRTVQLLREAEINDCLSYELHVPLPVNKFKMLSTLERFCEPPPGFLRTLYGNEHRIGGEVLADVKNIRVAAVQRPLHSTQDNVWAKYARWYHKNFPDRCCYEKEN
jgi:hypothetical protein